MWHRSILDTIEHAKQRGLCLYGAGFWGEVAYQLFTKLGVTPLCYCDDDPDKWGEAYQGLPVHSLEEATQKYPGAVYIPCVNAATDRGINDRHSFIAMRQRLKDFGVYDAHSELRIILYLFLLDLKNVEGITDIRIEDAVAKEEGIIEADDIQNVLIFNHMSNSGSYYFDQLLDGHPDIVSIPYITDLFHLVYERRLKFLEGADLLIEMTAQMLGYLHSDYEDLQRGRKNRFGSWCLDKDGNFLKGFLIWPDDFVRNLRMQFGSHVKLASFGHMMKIYAAAYSNSIGKRRKDANGAVWLFYHVHNPGLSTQELHGFFEENEFQRKEVLIIIREPVQHCFAWTRAMTAAAKDIHLFDKDKLFSNVLKCELGNWLTRTEGYDVQVVRLEDLKYRSEDTMRRLCEWLGIPYLDILANTTLNGLQVYFPTVTESGERYYITGNDTTSVDRKDFSEAMTLWDEARLNMVCAKFKKAYGYKNDVPDFMEFSEAAREEIMKEDFKFATIVQDLLDREVPEESRYDVNQFVKELYLDFMRGYQEGTEYYGYIRPEAKCKDTE